MSCAGLLKLTVVLSEQGGAYREYSNALYAKLSGKNITVTVVDADQKLPDGDLVVAAGMKAALNVARAKPSAMLAVLVPKEGFDSLQTDYPVEINAGTRTFSAIYLDQPFKRQLDLITALLPKTRSVAVLYATPPQELSRLRRLVVTKGLEFNERSLHFTAGLYAALQGLLASSDVLLALPDTEVYNTTTIRNILLASYRKNVPLIGFSQGFVRAGALAGVFSTPEQIASQSLLVIEEYAVSHTLPAAQHPVEFEVSVNEQVARSLGLNLKSATQLRSEIGAIP